MNGRLEVEMKSEQGQTMAEYGVILTMITIAVVTLFTALSDRIEAAVDRAIALLP